MIWTTYRRHVPALVIMIIAAGLWLGLLPFLPDPLTVYCSFSDNPVFATEPITPLIAMCGFMLMSHIVIVFIDLFFIAPAVPGYIMALVDWIVEGFTAVFYLSILGAAADILPCIIGLVGGYLAMLVVLGVLYRRSKESVEEAATPLFSSPYFERVAPSFMTRVFFFLRPMFPLYIIIVPGGIRIIGVLYDITYPWERIAELKEGAFFTFFSNRPIKLNQTLSNTVEIRLKERRSYPLISVADRDRFLKTAANLMAGR